jgi:hypothetical protein
MPNSEFTCSDCGKEFASQKALSGHIGGSTKLIGSYNVVTKHGSRASYQKHVRLGEDPCLTCSNKNADYMRNYRAKARLVTRQKGKNAGKSN